MVTEKLKGKRADLKIRLPREVRQRLRDKKAKTGASMAWLIERYIREGLERDAEAAR